MSEEITATALRKAQKKCVDDMGEMVRKMRKDILHALVIDQGGDFNDRRLNATKVIADLILKEYLNHARISFDKFNGWG